MSRTVWGDILHVDLCTCRMRREPISDELKRHFVGGRGINSKILYDEVKPGTDPLSPENVLIIGSGPLTGTYAPGSGRWEATAKSPLTGIHGDGNAGGHFAAQLKFAGIQHLVIHGKAEKPVYLAIDDDKVEIRDAQHLWGKDTWQTQEMIKEEWRDPRVEAAVIGPAGENLVKFACILNGLTRAVGRGGMGTVMGSKNLKAIAARGTKGLKVAKPGYFKRAVVDINRLIMAHPIYQEFSQTGTLGSTDEAYEAGALTAYNHRQTRMEGCELMGGGKASRRTREFTAKHKACFSCPIGCSGYFVIREGPYAGCHGDRCELAVSCSMGLGCGINSYPPLLYISTLINRWGLDIAELTNEMSFIMDCYDRGIITKEDTDGLEMNFGNERTIIEMTRKIALREGFGNLLAEGIVPVVKQLGEKAEYLAAQIHGLLFYTGDYRANTPAALSYATSTRGADHLRGVPSGTYWYDAPDAEEVKEVLIERYGTAELPPKTSYEGNAKIPVFTQDFNTLQDSLSTCRFYCEFYLILGLQPRHFAPLLSAATGMDFSGDDLRKVGERVWNVERAFNCREGANRDGDRFPQRFFEEPIPDGPTAGAMLDRDKFERLKDEYYELRGWDVKTGIPTRKKLKELGLKYIADELESTTRTS